MARKAEAMDRVLSETQEHAIVAIASGSTVAQAAERSGVGTEAVRGWLAEDPDFIAALNQAKLEQSDRLRAEVRGLASEAVSTLHELLTGAETPPAVRLRVALAILDTAGATKAETIGPTDPVEIRAELLKRGLFARLGA